jgi:hypothetical protein
MKYVYKICIGEDRSDLGKGLILALISLYLISFISFPRGATGWITEVPMVSLDTYISQIDFCHIFDVIWVI